MSLVDSVYTRRLEAIARHPPDWVREAGPETLESLWLLKFGDAWVSEVQVINENYYNVLLELLTGRRLDEITITEGSSISERLVRKYRLAKEGT